MTTKISELHLDSNPLGAFYPTPDEHGVHAPIAFAGNSGSGIRSRLFHGVACNQVHFGSEPPAPVVSVTYIMETLLAVSVYRVIVSGEPHFREIHR